MATRKTGPVKPPVLDMEARKTTENAKPGTTARKAAPKPPFWQALPMASVAAGIGGALLGLVLAYFVALLGYWPQPAPPPDTSSAEIARLSADITVLTNAQKTLSEKSAQAQALLDQTSSELATARAEIEKLAATPIPESVDAATLEALKAELISRINAITAGASPELADQLTAELKASAQSLSDLSTRLAKLETAASAAPAPITPSPQTTQLPLAITAMENALRSGRPFTAELDAITANLPDLSVPANLSQTGKTGLTPPPSIAEAFNAAIPELLAAIPAKPDASLQERLMEQARTLLALRPVGAVAGDDPEALIARLEAALAVPDFAKAETLVAALPQAMRQLISGISKDISDQAEAEAFLDTARNAQKAGDVSQ